MTQMETQDTEITLGTGRLLGLFFGLVIVCALFFGLGFSMGKSSQKSTLTMEQAPTVTMQAQAGAAPKSAGGAVAKPDKPADCSTPDCQPEQRQANDAGQTPVVTSTAATAPELNKANSGNGSFTVQIAAVSKQEDADALVSALRKKAYPVFIAGNNADKLFHVQIGPFAELKDAESMKAKLTGDGYNPIVKK